MKNTQKITKAMKMVAAAKLRRAQLAVNATRPYAQSLKGILDEIRAKNPDLSHPFFNASETTAKKACVWVFTSNRGLCGGFNSNLLRRTETFFKSDMVDYQLLDVNVIGKKGREFFKARKREVKNVYLDYAENLSPEKSLEIANEMLTGYLNGDYSEYWIAYNQFKSALVQEVTIEKIVPLSSSEEKVIDQTQSQNLVDYVYEPSKTEILENLIPRLVAIQLYRAHRESLASELGARMTAMENASNNAKDMIRLLTLEYNRLRQAAITTELMDIVNGAESIK